MIYQYNKKTTLSNYILHSPKSNLNSLLIGSGLVAAVLLCMKRGHLFVKIAIVNEL